MSALTGCKVLELAQTPIASLCTMTLGDFGAEVLKIDAPGMPGVLAPERSEMAFYPMYRNKKNMALNLKSEKGREIFIELVKTADVVIEGFRPGVLKRLQIDYETISKINPRIIYCSISGYGQDGPYRELPGHDINYISIGGALGLIGTADSAPAIPMNWIADWAGGVLHAIIGILLAMAARTNTGRGQNVDISMTDGAVALLSSLTPDYFRTGVEPAQGEICLAGSFPYYDIYKTKDDRYISIGCLEPVFWDNLCRELGREDFMPYKFTNEHRLQKAQGEKWDEIATFLKETFLTRTSDEWVADLSNKNIPLAKANTISEVFSDPQILHRKMLLEFDHPELGKVKQVGIAIKLSDTPGEVKSLAPLPGAHTDGILREMGYSGGDIETFRSEGIVG